MERLVVLAEVLAPQLQWPAAEAPSHAAFDTATELSDLFNNLQDADELGGALGARNAFLALSSRLGSLAVALKQQQAGAEQAADPGDAFCLQASAACLALNVVLQCVEDWSEGEWLRLLTAAVIPLEVLPPILLARARLAVASTEAGTAEGEAAGSADLDCSTQIHCLDGQLQYMSEAVYCLVNRVIADVVDIPERVRRAVRAAQFKPARLLAWLRCVAQTATILRAAGGRSADYYLAVITFLQPEAKGSELAVGVAASIPAQCELLQLADSWLLLPAGELATAVADTLTCTSLSGAAQLAAAECIREARQRHEIGGSTSQGPRTSLLQSVASLAALPQLFERRGGPAQAGLLIDTLKLLATLVDDAAAYQQAWGYALPAQHFHRLMQQLGSPGGLPLLCQLAAEVAAAGEAASTQGAACAGGAEGSSCGGGGAATAPASAPGFGDLAWRPVCIDWTGVLVGWTLAFSRLTTSPVWPSGPPYAVDPDSMGAQTIFPMLRAAAPLLRLAALAPRQPADPHDVGSRRRSAAQVMAAASAGAHGAEHKKPACCAMADQAVNLACKLLRVSRAEQAAAGAEAAAAAFAALATACRCAHAVCADARDGGVGGAEPGANAWRPSLGSAVGDALLTSHAIQRQRWAALQDGPERDAAVRQMECGLLLYLSTVDTLCRCRLDISLPECGNWCHVLTVLLKDGTLGPLWRQLLGPVTWRDGDAAAAAGMDARRLLAEVAAVPMQCLPDSLARQANAQFAGGKAAMHMLQQAMEVQPAAAATLADHSMLLSALSGVGQALLKERKRTQEVRLLTTCLHGLLRQLAPHLPADVAGGLTSLQPAGDVARSRAALERLGGYSLFLLQTGAEEEEEKQQCLSRSRRRHPLGSEAQQLAVRRAHALACCTGCANPRCSRLDDISAAETRGKLCSVCRTVRFCSAACSKNEWAQHKWACKLL